MGFESCEIFDRPGLDELGSQAHAAEVNDAGEDLERTAGAGAGGHGYGGELEASENDLLGVEGLADFHHRGFGERLELLEAETAVGFFDIVAFDGEHATISK